jgi:5-methylthioribose kinase
VKVQCIGTSLGSFLGDTICQSERLLSVDSSSFREFEGNFEMKELLIKVCYVDPFDVDTKTLPGFWRSVAEDLITGQALSRRDFLLERIQNAREALLHGDLHSGSVLVGPNNEVKCIDAEFCFVGPASFDIGVLIANFLVSAVAHWQSNRSFSDWIFLQIEDTWREFGQRSSQWNSGIDLSAVLSEALGHAAVEIVRRILGIAHLADLEQLELPQKLACERKCLLLARALLLDTSQVSISHVVELSHSVLKDWTC